MLLILLFAETYGIPEALIEAAAKSDPQGFLLFDDLPNQTEPATGHAKESTSEQSI